MEHSQKTAGRLIVAGGQAPELLEAAEEALDFVAVAVQVAVNHPFCKAVFLAGNHHASARGRNQFHDGRTMET